MAAPDSQRPLGGLLAAPRDRVFWILVALASLTRLVWVIWVHPPQDHVFSDMAHYVHRAELVARFEVEAGMRKMAWQAYGTHALLAIPMVLLGPGASALEVASLIWAACSAATVVLTYALAWVVLPHPHRDRARPHGPALAVGVATLLWFPLISHTGFFTSEAPYTCALLATTLAAVRVMRTGEGAGRAGLWAALAFVLRPQTAVFVVLLGLAWLVDRRRPSWSARIDWRVVARYAGPIVAAVLVSALRFSYYTGELGLVAENATMNLTAGRCHNIVTRAYDSEAEREASARDGQRRHVRRVSLPGFRALAREGPDHPLALDPALGTEAVDVVGYIGDGEAHAALRRRCYAQTGLVGQLRYAAVNVALLAVVARPWPESSDYGAPHWLEPALRARDLAAVLTPLALFGLGLALIRWVRARRSGVEAGELDRRAGLGVCALQLSALLVIAAMFFGTPRLRTPYDPYAMILIASVVAWAVEAWRQRS